MQLDSLRTPSGFLKLWEIVLSIIIVSVSQSIEGFSFGNERRFIFCGGVMVMSLVVTPLLVISYILGSSREMQKAHFEMLFNAILAVFMVSAGAVTINTAFGYNVGKYPNLQQAADSMKTVGSFFIINSVFYGLDTFFAYKNRE